MARTPTMRLEEARKHLRDIEKLMAAADGLRDICPDPATRSEDVRFYLATVDAYLSGRTDSLPSAKEPLDSDPPAAPRRWRTVQDDLPS